MDVVSKLHVHRGLRKSRKLCFNLCSIKWNRPNQSLLATATQHDCGYNCNPTWLWILIVSKCNSQIKLIMWCYICYRYIKFVPFIHSALQLKNAIFALFLVTKMSNAGIRSWKYFGDFRLIEKILWKWQSFRIHHLSLRYFIRSSLYFPVIAPVIAGVALYGIVSKVSVNFSFRGFS